MTTDGIDYDAAKLGWEIFQSLILLVFFIHTALSNRHKNNKQAIDDMAAKVATIESDLDQVNAAQIRREIDEIENRVIAMDERLKSLPTVEDIRSLERQLSALDQSHRASANLLATIHEYLLNKDK